jgi:hypothetical protein
VRVQIGRLRRQLDRYYASEGQFAARRITIPLGSHQIELMDVAPAPAQEPQLSEEKAEESGIALTTPLPSVPYHFVVADPETMLRPPVRRMSLVMMAVLGCIIVTATALLLSRDVSLRAALPVAHSDSPLFWKQFFDNGKPTRIVLPAPLFFAWNPKDSDSLMVRDISVNDFNHPQSSPELTRMEKRLGKPARWQNYTVASDTFAALRLARFLDKFGIQTSFSSSEDSPHGIVDHENLIAFGTVTSMVAFTPEIDSLSFRLGPHERYVTDMRMPPGSPPQFRMIIEPNQRAVVPGIVALLPRGTSGSRILLLQGEQTAALIAYLTSDEGMHELTRAMHGTNSPFFESVILSEVNGDDPIQSRLAAFRSLSSQSLAAQQASLPRPSFASGSPEAADDFPGHALSPTK